MTRHQRKQSFVFKTQKKAKCPQTCDWRCVEKATRQPAVCREAGQPPDCIKMFQAQPGPALAEITP